MAGKTKYNPEGLHNFFYNGWLDLWQRTGSTVTTINGVAVGTYTADRITFSSGGTTNKNARISRSTNTPVIGKESPSFSFEFTPLTAITSMSAGDIVQPFRQKFEGFDYAKLHEKECTFGFFIQTNKTGKMPVAFLKFITPSTYESMVTSVDIFPSEAGQWVYKEAKVKWTSTIPDSWTSSSAVQMEIGACSGSSYHATTQGVWMPGNYKTASDMINIMDSTSNYLRIAAVHLVIGEGYGPNYYRRNGVDYAGDLKNCQRYFEKSYDTDVAVGTAGAGGGSSNNISPGTAANLVVHAIRFSTPKRVTNPAITLYNPVTGAAGTMDNNGTPRAVTAGSIGNSGFIATSTVTTNALNNHFLHWVADAEL